MSTNPDLKECHIDKAQSSLVDFVATMKESFETNRKDLSGMANVDTCEWAKNLLRSSQDVKCQDVDRQKLIDDLRAFVKDVRKAFSKHQGDLGAIQVDPMIDAGRGLLERSGYEPPPRVSTPSRRMSP